jgi:hypothetical protein
MQRDEVDDDGDLLGEVVEYDTNYNNDDDVYLLVGLRSSFFLTD